MSMFKLPLLRERDGKIGERGKSREFSCGWNRTGADHSKGVMQAKKLGGPMRAREARECDFFKGCERAKRASAIFFRVLFSMNFLHNIVW